MTASVATKEKIEGDTSPWEKKDNYQIKLKSFIFYLCHKGCPKINNISLILINDINEITYA